MTVSALADIATEQFGRTGTDYTNAKKHMFWSALLTLTFDGEFAREVTDRHENLAPYLGEVIGFDTAMDLINSEVGISIGEEIKLRHQTRPVETAYDLLPDYREIDAMMTVALVENRAVLLTWNESKG